MLQMMAVEITDTETSWNHEEKNSTKMQSVQKPTKALKIANNARSHDQVARTKSNGLVKQGW